MKILHVAPTLDARGGGTSTAIVGLARAQQSAGLDVRIAITPRANDDLRFAEALRGEGIPVEQVQGRGKLCRNPAMKPMLDCAIADADVVHIHALWEEIQHVAARAAQRLNVPHVITPHGMLTPWSFAKRSQWLKKLMMLWRVRRNLDRASAIHFATQMECQWTSHLRLRPPSIVEPFGLDLNEFNDFPSPQSFREKFPMLGDRPYIIFLGRQAKGKGIEVLIPAFAKIARDVPETTLVIAGQDWENLQVGWEQLAVSEGIRDRVLFTGMLRGAERLSALAGAVVFGLPSAHENFGISVIEALACGVPVIISDQVCLHPDVSGGGVRRAGLGRHQATSVSDSASWFRPKAAS